MAAPHVISRIAPLVLAAVFACTSNPKPIAAPRPATTAREANAAVVTAPPPEDPDDAAIAKAAQDYLDLLVDISPEAGTALGLHKNDALLDDRTVVGEDTAVDREEAMAKALRARFGSPRASASAKTDLAMLIGALEVDVRLRRVQRRLQRMPDLYASPLTAIFLMTSRDYAPAEERARNVLARLEKIPKVVAAAKDNLLNPPRVWTEVGIDQASSAKAFLEQQRAFLERALPGDKARVDAAIKIATDAYEDYKKFLQKEVLPRSNGRFSAGRELFQFLLSNDSFLDQDVGQLLAMGREVFASTQAEMTALAKKLDPNAKGWGEVVAKRKGKHPSAGELLASYRAEVARARKFLVDKDAVALPQGDDLEVVETPPFLRSTVSAAYDRSPPFDPVTKGFFFVTPIDTSLSKKRQEEALRENDHGDIVNTAVHEAYPGHHLQLSFARKSPSLARKALGSALLEEGWALYGEELMAELGYYSDEERLMQLEWTLVRAARVILDIGLHVGDMTFEQAVKFLTDDVHLERQLALSEVKRYTMTPTQPLAYLVGRQLIFGMRDRYREREGAKFSLKRFHADVLSRGSVAPSLLAREIFAAPGRASAISP